QGFTRFIIGDHESRDGTTELLEALEDAGVLERRAVWSAEGRVTQVDFYNRVARDFARGADPILGFLDADEFILGDGRGRLARRVARVFRDDEVSALGLNWRVYGSSGYDRSNAGPVLLRFAAHAGQSFEKNRWVKSFVRRSRLAEADVHTAKLRTGRYVDARGNALRPETVGLHRTADITWDGLFIGHFIVKSRQEFERKKRFRGSATFGREVEKGPRYFVAHDRNERHAPLGRRAFRAMMKEYTGLLERLEASSLYYRSCFGGVRVVRGTRTLQGWLAYAGPRLGSVRVTLRGDDRAWHCPAIEDGEWRAPEGGPVLPKLAFSLSLEDLGEVDPDRLEIRPHGSCVRLPLETGTGGS
ncbi:MAG: glycosyltransferase family 2 protein, partial [Xanthomonadales bacterium]|nr:glycosyltransferase family 2 protein [Xanthomonadales bacterium]